MYPRPPAETLSMCSKRSMFALDRCFAAGWTAENCALQPPPLYCPGTCVYVNVYACMHIHASVCEHEYGYVCVYSCVCVCVCVCITHTYIPALLSHQHLSLGDTLYHVLRRFTIIYDPLCSAFWYTRTFSGRLNANIFLARSSSSVHAGARGPEAGHAPRRRV